MPRVHRFLRSSGLYASLGAHAGSSQDARRRVSLPTNRTFWPPSAIDFQLCVALRSDTGLRGRVRAVLTFSAAQRSNRFREHAHVCGKGCVSSGRAGAPAMPIQYTVLTVFICFTGIGGRRSATLTALWPVFPAALTTPLPTSAAGVARCSQTGIIVSSRSCVSCG